jgi:hypothetical protein
MLSTAVAACAPDVLDLGVDLLARLRRDLRDQFVEGREHAKALFVTEPVGACFVLLDGFADHEALRLSKASRDPADSPDGLVIEGVRDLHHTGPYYHTDMAPGLG